MLQGSCPGSLRGPGALRCGRFPCRTHQGELEHEGWVQHGLHASLSPPSPPLTQPRRSWQHIPVIPGTERGSSPTLNPLTHRVRSNRVFPQRTRLVVQFCIFSRSFPARPCSRALRFVVGLSWCEGSSWWVFGGLEHLRED